MEHGDLDYSGDSGHSEKWLDPGYTLKMGPTEFAEGWDVGCERERKD